MAEEKTVEELQMELELLRRRCRWEKITKIVEIVFKYSALVLVAFFLRQVVGDLSGKTTLADINFQASLNASEATVAADAKQEISDFNRYVNYLAFIFGLTGLVYGRKQEKLRKDAVEELHSRIKQYELQEDQNRTSSRLTPRGDTRPEDI